MSKKVINIAIIGVLALGVVGIGITAYRQRVQADTIVAGYATAHFHFNITVPIAQNIKVKATFTPSSGKNFYFKEREFEITNTGLNTVEWYVRKIPEGTYNLTLVSPQGDIQSGAKEVSLKIDKVNEMGDFSLDLGSPAVQQETTVAPVADQATQTVAPSQQTTTPTSGDEIPFPPIPEI